MSDSIRNLFVCIGNKMILTLQTTTLNTEAGSSVVAWRTTSYENDQRT